ncbi:uncharacterized protein A4U43_C03F24540 [Asparagus officinalis]|uniref:Disease resistance R13L4/SHOC-2-like LRR domain-containing protein n=1 Tax=Asparagus officinalis TaxID=4686 RepID=A0A5P1FFH8_ASPOF|nr:uncharacterized protein A4U43_C03F24540 [Asparagus officinalis]
MEEVRNVYLPALLTMDIQVIPEAASSKENELGRPPSEAEIFIETRKKKINPQGEKTINLIVSPPDLVFYGPRTELPSRATPESFTVINLLELDFSNNSLSGPIPAELGKLTNLTSLGLFSNNLTGKIPPEIGNMTSLGYLDVNTNQLEGELPSTISQLENLQTLQVFTNNFTGALPQDLGKHGLLVTASFSNNSFSGPLPPTLCSGFKL